VDGVPRRNADVICYAKAVRCHLRPSVHPSIRPRSGKVEKRRSGEAEKWRSGVVEKRVQRRMTTSSALHRSAWTLSFLSKKGGGRPLLHYSASPLCGWTDGVPRRNADVICVHPRSGGAGAKADDYVVRVALDYVDALDYVEAVWAGSCLGKKVLLNHCMICRNCRWRCTI
jgi:hypothetical protein